LKRTIVIAIQCAEFSVAYASRVFQHSAKHRLQLAGRTADDLEHFRGGGLLFQRLREVVGALAQLTEQSRVLNGDDGLRSEILHQLDLLVGERPYLLAINHDRADQFTFLEHRHSQECSRTSTLDQSDNPVIAIQVALVL
jgi:hypothetical protein